MRRIYLIAVVICLSLAFLASGEAKQYLLFNKTIIEGEIVDISEDGIVVKADSGDFGNRIDWVDLSQDSLKQIVAEHPDAFDYADPYIELPRVEREGLQQIPVQEVPRPVIPDRKAGLIASLMTPMGMVMLGVLLFANVFVAYEIAAYRNQAPALVCAVSAVLPVLGPIIFISLPSRERYEESVGESVEDDGYGYGAPPPPSATAPSGVGVPGGGGLSLATREEDGVAGAGAPQQTKVFYASQHTINRRFLESQFAGFFRVVPSPAEKDLVLVFKTPKQTYVAKRISRISSNDCHIQLLRAGGTTEKQLGFNEIEEIRIRHKDAKE